MSFQRMKISPPSSQRSQRDYFPLRHSIRRGFLPFSLALCGSKPSSQRSQRDYFPLRHSIGEEFLPFSLALCGSKPSSQRSQRDDFPLRRSIRKDFLPFSLALCALCGSKPSSQRSQRDYSPQTQHTQGFPSILSCSLCSLWLKYQSHWSSTPHRERIQSSGSQKTTSAGDCFSRCAPSQGHFANCQVVRLSFPGFFRADSDGTILLVASFFFFIQIGG
jgi:hypothetical protein